MAPAAPLTASPMSMAVARVAAELQRLKEMMEEQVFGDYLCVIALIVFLTILTLLFVVVRRLATTVHSGLVPLEPELVLTHPLVPVKMDVNVFVEGEKQGVKRVLARKAVDVKRPKLYDPPAYSEESV